MTRSCHTLLVALLFAVAPAAARAATTELADAAGRRDWTKAAALLKQGADANQAQADGATALHWAARYGNADVIQQLIAAGGAADARNRYGVTPLALACEAGSGACVQRLLESGADANHQLAGGESMLMIASRTGRPEPVRLLLAQGARVNATDRSGQTALMWAAAEGAKEAIELLVGAGAAVDARLDSGFTALLFAAREGRADAIAALLKAGASAADAIETKRGGGGRGAPNGTTAVDLAVENGHFQLAMQLIKAGAGPNDARGGFTPLHRLVWVRRPPRGDDESGQPPPEMRGRLSSLDFISAMVAAGADVNAVPAAGAKSRAVGSIGISGATPFLLACRTADLAMMKRLVELGADPLRANADGSTPLMAAAGLGCTAPDEEAGTEDECVAACEYLVALGADVNAVDAHNQTAMHGAAFKSLPKVARLLAAKGAKIGVWNRKSDKGWTPLLIAQGFRPGNFKPDVPTIEAISDLMRAQGVAPPPPPDRESLPKKKGYDPSK